jgi:hypothetical protein
MMKNISEGGVRYIEDWLLMKLKIKHEFDEKIHDL